MAKKYFDYRSITFRVSLETTAKDEPTYRVKIVTVNENGERNPDRFEDQRYDDLMRELMWHATDVKRYARRTELYATQAAKERIGPNAYENLDRAVGLMNAHARDRETLEKLARELE